MRNGIMAVFLAAAVATVSPCAIANDDITEDRMIKRMEFEIALQRLSKKVYTKADETAWAAAQEDKPLWQSTRNSSKGRNLHWANRTSCVFKDVPTTVHVLT